jgi:hypothetical protein
VRLVFRSLLAWRFSRRRVELLYGAVHDRAPGRGAGPLEVGAGFRYWLRPIPTLPVLAPGQHPHPGAGLNEPL